MFPTRAASFVARADSRLVRDQDWPRLPEIAFDRVVGVALDSRERLYVAHRGARPLLRLHADGTLDREIGADVLHPSIAYDVSGPVPKPLGTRYWMHGLHLDPWDNIWVTDVSRHLVFQFNPDGRLLRTLGVDGEPGCDARHFALPTHVCVTPTGDIFVTDGYGNSRVVQFDPQGNFVRDWGTRGTAPGEFHTPHVIVRGRDGRLYVTDRENDRIQVFTPEGRRAAVWPDLHSVDGLYAAPDGWLYASAGIDRALLRLNPDGLILDTWVRPDLFSYPHAIAVARDGAIYVADTGDFWTVTGRLPAERAMEPRAGSERSALLKLFIR